MPEFEEPAENSNSQQNYTPSTDASKKPRTRRRSGGFKTEVATPNLSIGEVDPVDALKKEKLSGPATPAPEKREDKPARRDNPPKKRSESRSPRNRDSDSDERPRGNAQPSPETLAAIEAVEARLAERKKERDTRRSDRDKSRPARSDKKPQSRQSSSGNKKPSGGIIDSILSFFGLGPKQPAKKTGGKGKPSGSKSKAGDRPRSKGGSRGGQSQNRRGGKGRRSSGGGGNRLRRNDNRNRSEES